MSEQFNSCLIYVEKTSDLRAEARFQLLDAGFAVQELDASLSNPQLSVTTLGILPPAFLECVLGAELLVFLLPEHEGDDGRMDDLARFASSAGKRMVGIARGDRSKYPEYLDDLASAILREGSDQVQGAICGAEIWEPPPHVQAADRPIKHIICQTR